jgi:hypothetical protein
MRMLKPAGIIEMHPDWKRHGVASCLQCVPQEK